MLVGVFATLIHAAGPLLRLLRGAARQAEFRVLAAALTILLGAWGFIGVTTEVLEGEHQALDEAVLIALRRPDDPQMPIGPAWLAEVGRDCTALGGFVVLILISGVVAGTLALTHRYRALVMTVVATGGGILLCTALKHLVMRPRPAVVPHLTRVVTSGFPSGHAMLSAVVYLTLAAMVARHVRAARLRVFLILIALALTVLVGISRVFLGVHYTSDVLAGWSAGLTWAGVCWLIDDALRRRSDRRTYALTTHRRARVDDHHEDPNRD
jgi:undecaprenyl-diphosphatase